MNVKIDSQALSPNVFPRGICGKSIPRLYNEITNLKTLDVSSTRN